MNRGLACAALLLLGLAGCGVSLVPPDRFGDGRISDEQWPAYLRLVEEKTAEPRSPEKMKEAVAIYEDMVASRTGDFATMLAATEASVWLAENGETPADRSCYSELGIHFGRGAVKLWGWDARPHYYLALALGFHAREHPSKAMALISEMEEHALEARNWNEGYDDAGPHRFLGLLYAQAPEPPSSIGDPAAAREHLERALELAPGSPENHAAMGEFLLDQGEDERAREQIEKALEILASEEWRSRADAPRIRANAEELLKELE
ncbi:MAG: tetratricopeptide repeat protein [Planctomycetes bacterium]|nr:tetratricopeptide repeat protein [Planctomycetota bacterium]